MTYSENYNFSLPEDEDGYDIAPLSENFEAIDGILAEQETQAIEINEKIGTPTENGQTLFSLLENSSSEGFTAIKSIQQIIAGCTSGETTTQISLKKTVIASNCIVLMQPLTITGAIRSYTLNNTSITTTHGNAMADKDKFCFWVIEFC